MNEWPVIKSEAKMFFQSKEIFTSFIEKKCYRIEKLYDDKIIIERVSGGNSAVFGKDAVNAAIEKIKNIKRIKKGNLIGSVVRETTLIRLHPCIHWDAKSKEVYWDDSRVTSLDLTTKFVEQASDDDLEKISILVNKRKNQSKFRSSLIILYNNKCAISNVDSEDVLEAAHILPHSKKGINTPNNGILLRSDLHKLFDNDKLLIHPKKLTVHLDPVLTNSYYSKFEGKVLANRIDNYVPSEDYLNEKWESVDWTRTL